MKLVHGRFLLPLLTAGVAAALAGCGGGGGGGGAASQTASPGIHLGQSAAVGNGMLQTFVNVGSNGKPTAMGAFLTEAALTGLPATGRPEYDSAMPSDAPVVIDHLGLDWSPQGHAPVGIYDVPHFDFHFYTISKQEQDSIPLGQRIEPPADEIPLGYAPAPDLTFLHEGWHWVDISSPEFNGHPFTIGFLYGFAFGHMVFVEPAMTNAFMATKASFAKSIPVPEAVRKHGLYPSHYSFGFDPNAKQWVVSLDGLVSK